MTIKTISGTYGNGYTLAPNYTGLSITSAGLVASAIGSAGPNGAAGGAAGAAVTLPNGGILANDGHIQAGAGGRGGDNSTAFGTGGIGGAGGSGVVLSAIGSVTNHGAIMGGAAGAGGMGGPGYYVAGFGGVGGVGGVGISLSAGGGVTNTGALTGGAGGNGGAPGNENSQYGAGGNGGDGVDLSAGGSATNLGAIVGGQGGLGGRARFGFSPPGVQGTGVALSAGGAVTNGAAGDTTALIEGGVGVQVAGAGTVINFGTIQGTAGDSVAFASSSDRLIAEAGSAFLGQVFGGGGTLELAGGTGTITGLGATGTLSGGVTATFTGFGAYVIDAGAAWKLTGANTLAAGQTLNVNGGLTNAGTLSGAGALGGAGSLVNRALGVVNANGAAALTLGVTTATNAGLIEATGAGGLVIQSAVKNNGTLAAQGGTLTVNGAVTGMGRATVNGATLDFASSFTQNVAFTGTAGVLELARSQSYTGRVSGFSKTGGTSLDLRDIAFVSANEATFSRGILTVTDGTHTAHIRLAGNFTGSTFIASSDGHGGVTVIDPPNGGSASVVPLRPLDTAARHQFIAAMAGLGGSAAGAIHTSEAGPVHAPILAKPA